MSDATIYHSNIIVPPMQGRVWVVGVTTTTAYLDMWTAYANVDSSELIQNFLTDRYITLRASGSGIFYCVTTGTGTAITTPGSTSSTAPSASAGVPLADGEIVQFVMPKRPNPQASSLTPPRYLGLVTSSGTATAYIWPSSGTGRVGM